jgi:hypothetical protein
MSSIAFLPEFVGATVADAGLHACAGEPAGEAVGIVIAAFRSFLEAGHAAKLGAQDDECVLQKTALLGVLRVARAMNF